MKNLIVVLFSVLLLTACGEDQWTGFVYPNKFNFTERQDIGVFQSYDECRAAAQAILAKQANPDDGEFECGRGCDDTYGSGPQVCKETRK